MFLDRYFRILTVIYLYTLLQYSSTCASIAVWIVSYVVFGFYLDDGRVIMNGCLQLEVKKIGNDIKRLQSDPKSDA